MDNHNNHSNRPASASGGGTQILLTIMLIIAVIKVFMFLGEYRSQKAKNDFATSEAGIELQLKLTISSECRQLYPGNFYMQQRCEDDVYDLMELLESNPQ